MGLVKVKYLKNHGRFEKDAETTMHESTAKALESHKVVKIIKGKEDK